MSQSSNLDFISRTEFPPFAVACVGDRCVIIGGGGGAAKTGIKNKFEVYQLYHDGQQTRARCVLSYDVGDACISNMAAWVVPPENAQTNAQTTGLKTDAAGNVSSASARSSSSSGVGSSTRRSTTPCPTINLAIGKEECCTILRLTPKLVLEDDSSERIPEKSQEAVDGSSVRKRGGKQESQNSNNSSKKSVMNGKTSNRKLNLHNSYYTFTVTHLSTTTTVFSRPSTTPSTPSSAPAEDIYQKVVRVSRDCALLATGGTDGCVRLWSLRGNGDGQRAVLSVTTAAHSRAVDDLDLRPDGKHVVSICKGARECCVWSAQDGKKLVQLSLNHPTPSNVKYRFSWARYGTIEGATNDVRLYTTSNPLVGSRNPGVVARWCGNKYTQQRAQTVTGALSNLAVTDDGRYLAVGTMDGDLVVLIAFSLQPLHRLTNAHSVFITGLSWMPSFSRSSAVVRGVTDASLLSVACDNTLKLSHVNKQGGLVPVWLVAVLVALVLGGTFVLAAYLGL